MDIPNPLPEYAQSVDEFIAQLTLDPEQEQLVSEVGVLQSIYGDEAIRIWNPDHSEGKNHYLNDMAEVVRYEVHINLPPPYDDLEGIRVLVSLPSAYPTSAPPQLQLLSRYVGPFSVDSSLFGSILRTYISRDGVEWTPDTVCVFDGMENVRERCAKWYGDRLSEERAGELLREDEKERREEISKREPDYPKIQSNDHMPAPQPMPEGVQIVEADPITDRKSAFVGRACRITDPSQVPVILAHLTSDRRISRAAHPVINAWRCRVGSTVHQDNDDDGETAAGGRLAHLLQILDVENVLVVVTRYFGGIHLGPDRFKHINQAARNAIELGGFLDEPEERKASSRIKKKA